MDEVYLPKFGDGGQTRAQYQRVDQDVGKKGVRGRKGLSKVHRDMALAFRDKLYWATGARLGNCWKLGVFLYLLGDLIPDSQTISLSF